MISFLKAERDKMTAIEVKQKTTHFIVLTNEIVKEDDSQIGRAHV